MHIVRQANLVETPWKNGGGITRHIAANMDGDRVLWRLSMADVDGDGSFSNFAGLTRILTVIRGGGMILHLPEGVLMADHAEPVVFDGSTPVSAELTRGPLSDFNLMYDTAHFDGAASVLCGPFEKRFEGSGKTLVFHTIAGTLTLEDGETLETGDTAIAEDTPVRMSLAPGAIALCIWLERI